VSFLKAAEYQDGHAGYSDPIDEQHFLVREINQIQQSPDWKSTAVVVAYDDSDGWYDHAFSTPLNGSKDPAAGSNNLPTDSPACQAGPTAAGGYADRCGPGTRQPLLVVSPYSKVNTVDHTATEQASITQFIENNWSTGRIGDASFDQRAGTLANMFDFRHPNARQVLLNQDGSVKSVQPIPNSAYSGHAAATAANTASTDGVATEQLAETGSFSPAPPIGVGAAVVAGAAGVIEMRRRRA
jgi:phospholipase C